MISLQPDQPRSQKSLLDRVEDSLLPLINLVFLLLMFFIVSGKLAETPLPELPTATSEQPHQPPIADLVVHADGRWLVNGQPVTTEALGQALPEVQEGQALRIAAEGQLTMAALDQLLRQLEQLGYDEVILLTEPTS
ncbi:ExbD/TolR family protein [Marinobacter zhejiangensis]|uniref:Outer membrane transport energization protein ExbD n=1 Tax=Marinobacter zhejiangensis TaxID=488535 RepID=A0A1I4M1H2_9GAMM|nr:biopolymer transporter ExbD [Marinobacter zhejiangensis]SFL97054.1 outer membrane transport energization protein ExbD [Marinobacter zhejiangensis]